MEELKKSTNKYRTGLSVYQPIFELIDLLGVGPVAQSV
jgi:hypothetical protein